MFNAATFAVEPYYNPYTGMFQKGVFPTSTEYTWSDTKGSQTNNSTTGTLVDDGDKHWIHTDIPLSDLGTVTGAVTLTIEDSLIGTDGDGNIYGGGDESVVNNQANPAAASTIVSLKGSTTVKGNVFGGGNKGKVSGSTTVNIED